MKVSIKEADLSDSEIVYTLTKQAFQDYLDPAFSSQVPALQETKEEVKEDIKKKEVLLAYLGEQPVGTVRFFPMEDNIYHLTRLGVKNKFQGRKLGEKLIKEVEDRVRKKEGQKIILYSAYCKKELLAFYKSLGYKIEDVTEDDDYRRAKMVKRINN